MDEVCQYTDRLFSYAGKSFIYRFNASPRRIELTAFYKPNLVLRSSVCAVFVPTPRSEFTPSFG